MKTGRKAEVWIVLGLSLGQSALYAVVSLIAKLSRGPLGESTASLNPSRAAEPWLDLTLQLLAIGFALVPVALVLYLLTRDEGAPPVTERLGLDGKSPARDLAVGFGFAALIGLPGLGVYALGRHFGLTSELILAPEQQYFWTGAVLILAAVQNAVLEEIVAVGYLMTRLREFGRGTTAAVILSATLRASYHLYQGIGQAIGNFLMGLVFGWWFARGGRVMPLIIAHALIDIIAFLGYAWFGAALGLR